MSIPRWWYKNWHATDPLTYEQFNALFIRLTGLDQRTAHSRFYMTPVTSLRATFQHGRQVEVRQLGIPDFIWRRPRLWTSWFYASLGRWAQVGAFADVESKGLAVTYDELLHMSFFREAYAVNDEGGGTLDAEFVATLPPMDAAFAEKVYAALALRHGKRKHSGYASRLEVFA